MPGFQSTQLATEGALEPFFFLYTDDSIQGNPETCKQSSIMLNYEVKNTHGTKVIEVTPNSLNNILIPLPTIEQQQRIVDILDRFDKLCNDISEGLPAEIEARQKQYEYYRDKLLTFKKKEAAENE